MLKTIAWINELMKWVSHRYYFKDLAIFNLNIFSILIYIFLFFSISLECFWVLVEGPQWK